MSSKETKHNNSETTPNDSQASSPEAIQPKQQKSKSVIISAISSFYRFGIFAGAITFILSLLWIFFPSLFQPIEKTFQRASDSQLIILSYSIIIFFGMLLGMKFQNTFVKEKSTFQDIDDEREKTDDESKKEKYFNEVLVNKIRSSVVEDLLFYNEFMERNEDFAEYTPEVRKELWNAKLKQYETQSSLFLKITDSLSEQIKTFDRKASRMLDKGIGIAQSGVFLLISSIVIWNAYFHYFSITTKTEHYVGIASCSLIFIFLQTLAAWCLKQHRAYVDASLYVTKIRSIFERKMQAYLLIKEYGEGKDGYHKLLDNFLNDIEWPPEPLSAKQQTSYTKEAAETLTEVSKSLRVLHAAQEKPASSHRRYPNPSRT